ncbi:hypothetical protein L0337_13600 [candidate division KSB1 bacterium]|nr:hypothetical protein [candidate division KSB1 bacterium]
MTRPLNFNYDERDFLQIWNPALSSNFHPDFESGLYAMFGSAKLKGTKHAFDSIMIDDFSKAYSTVIIEVKRKEPPLEQENYDVPELGLHQVQLSRILEEIYCRFVEKKAPSRQKAEALV